MKQDNFLKLSLPLISVILFLINGCDSNKSKEHNIIGEWKAHWETAADESMPELNGENLKMTGLVKFMDNGKVEICAFGYDGCIFSDDTLKNTLNWKLDDTVLRFIDNGDDHGLPYTINKFTNKELHLTLLEDINLTLLRN
jgi:hypothetical protein